AFGQQGDIRSHLAGARPAAVRPADGPHPQRSGWPSLRRDCLLAWRRGRHSEIAAHASAAGASGCAAASSRMTLYVGCEYARERLEGLLDNELSVDEQVLVESHVRW